MHRSARLITILFVLATLLALPQTPTAAAQGEPFAFFPQTGHNIGMEVKRFFDANGGIDLFGLPLTEVLVDSSGLHVQYFERARFELRPNNPSGPTLSLSRLGAMLTEGRTEEAFNWLAASPDPNRHFFPESGHTLGGAFGWYWQSRGGLPVFGYPISEEFMEWNPEDGQVYLVQYFERARFEYHPEFIGTPYEVQLGMLGKQWLEHDPIAVASTAPAQPMVLLGEATTGFSSSANDRITNITRATEMATGYVIPSGAEFSFVNIGDFSEANGFVDGYAIVGGRLEKVIGGGLCQVSTTLFRAVSNAGLQITRRIGHSHIVNFYENILGFDATVFVPSTDFRWRNDSPAPVYVMGSVNRSTSRLTFQIWGNSDGRRVTYEGPYTKNWTKPGAPVWQYDKTLPKGAVRQLVHGRSGVDVNYYRIITFPDGTVRRTHYFTRYTPWEDFYIYGPGVTPPNGAVVIAPRS